MIDRGVTTEDPAPGFERADEADITWATLEQRVRRLEDVVATIQDTKQMEERVAERVADKVTRLGPSLPRESPSRLLDAGRRLLPAARELLLPAPPPASGTDGTNTATMPDVRPTWLLLEFWNELRLFLRMILDPRYRLTWIARVALLGFIPFILISFWLVPGSSIPVVGSLVDKVVDLLVAFLVYKIFVREANFYRRAVHGLPVRYRT